MDTKLKNSKYHPLIKLVAILLTIIFAFFTGINALRFLRKGVFYASEDASFKNTPAFAAQIRNTLWDNMCNFKEVTDFYDVYLSYGDYLNTDIAKDIINIYNEKEARAIKLFNTIQELKKLRPETIETENGTYTIDENDKVYLPEVDKYVNAYEFYNHYNQYYYNGEYSEQATSVVIYDYEHNEISYPSNDKELFAIKDSYTSYSDWNYKYQQLRSAIFDIVENAVSIEQIQAEIKEKKEAALDASYYENIELVTSQLNKLINIDFIFTNNKSGQTISNVPVNDRKDFIKNLKHDQLYYIEFDGEKLLSPANKLNHSTNLLKFLTDSHLLPDETIDEKFLTEHFAGFSLYLKLNENLVPGDNYYAMYGAFQDVRKTNANTYLVLTILCALLSVSCFIGCCIISGRRKNGTVKLIITDRIPFVLYLACTTVLVGLISVGVGFLALVDSDYNTGFISTDSPFIWVFTSEFIRNVIGLGFSLISLLLLSFVLYIVRNKKSGTFRNRFITIFIFRKIKTIARKAKAKLYEKGLTPEQIKRRIKIQTILFFSGYIVINIFFYILAIAELYPISITGIIIFNIPALVYAIIYINDVLKLANATEEIRNGNFQAIINPNSYIKPLRQFACDLSACRDGIENAINEAIKGEHLKTELITNVSHDLKTPLTSIINYVSLLKMGNIDKEEEKKYIDILDEKSKKLKRLIEDLTEASKANSGNIKMNIAQVNLNEMALQAVGENSDVLENEGLDVILTERDKEIIVNADSQHTFRIIDNLFSNAKKYSLKGTRVYVDVYKEKGLGVFEIKNISKEKLNIDPEELTERFVRGDNSRTTDGSGLGLSIARSFAELQNGIFNIEIDGDMFKAVVKLPLI